MKEEQSKWEKNIWEEMVEKISFILFLVFAKLIEKGLEMKDKDYKRTLKDKILGEVKTYNLMRKYATKLIYQLSCLTD